MDQSIWADPAFEPEKAISPPPTTSSALSAGATSFASDATAPPPDVASADMYAPSGIQQDDLFDDVAPVESMRLRSDDDLFADDFTPAPEPVVEPIKAQPTRGSGDVPRATGRARTGRGRGAHDGRGHQDRSGFRGNVRGAENTHRGNDRSQNQEQSQTAAAAAAAASVPENAPSGPRKETVASVRGDRHATGGVRKPKLTEEELAEKMAKIQIKNASLTAAHARAEADAASFAEREQQAKQITEQRRKEERRDRQQMMGEREKNRQRKLKAMEGREWDAEKQDGDFKKGGRFDKKGGFAGDQDDYTDGREYLYREPRGGDRGRGSARGGRGGRQQEAPLPKKEDFPALPTTGKAEKAEKAGPQPGENTIHPESVKTTGKSWADQVEAARTS